MDAVEAAEFGGDIVILQTVLEEVRHRSMPLYNRVLGLIGDEARRVFVFSNEARQCVGSLSNSWTYTTVRETYVARLESETPNDRNDRGRSCASTIASLTFDQPFESLPNGMALIWPLHCRQQAQVKRIGSACFCSQTTLTTEAKPRKKASRLAPVGFNYSL
jgi:hypothetical protein